jgi:LTXXQ motif family protein
MAMLKAGVAGAALGALALATVVFVAPIAAQGPGGSFGPPGGPRGSGGPPGDITGPGGGRGGDITGPMNRRGQDPNDPDITGPRGAVADCQERLARIAQVRLERIIRLVRPTDEQRGAFEELRMASAKALEVLRGACPTERPLTPTARMAAAEKWLEARLQAIRLVRPALDSFYRQLNDDQKIRWSMGPSVADRFDTDQREQYDPRQQDRRGPGFDRRDNDRRGDERREERWRDGRDRYGDERGRGGDDRFGERRRDDDRERWRDQRWREERGRDDRWRDDRWRSRRYGPDEDRL